MALQHCDEHTVKAAGKPYAPSDYHIPQERKEQFKWVKVEGIRSMTSDKVVNHFDSGLKSSKSGRIYLHTDIRLIIFRKSDLDAAAIHGQRSYELRTYTHGPMNPKFSPHKL
ncbi:protein FAM214A [Caerostris extrusa]|uniref:Protein FAM214A n=1 Tax=Caerostris extrusa TaxID=172846 RepID=A0AAV4W8I4_CAEEX|nr:protein FAM214A [Caerostris extrusa]